jgi:hypothetical protein
MKKWPYKRDGFSYKATPSVMKKWPYKRDGFSYKATPSVMKKVAL